MQNIVIHIQSLYPKFTPSEKKVADYFLNNMVEVYSHSIAELAEAAEVSPSTWVRFCKTLGLSGLKELKQALFDSVKGMEGAEKKEVTYFNDIRDHSSSAEIIEALKNTDVQALENTAQILEPGELDRAAKLLEQAQHVALFGVGASCLVASDFYFKLLRIGINVQFVSDLHIQRSLASSLDADDVAVYFSHSGRTMDILDLLEITRENGCPSIAICSVGRHPLAQGADIVLPTASPEVARRASAISSRLAQLYVTDCLFTRLANEHYEEVEPLLEKSYEVSEQYRLPY